MVEEADPGFSNPEDALTAIVANDTDLVELRAALPEHGDEMDPVLVDILETEWTAEQFTEAKKGRQEVNIELRRFLEDYDLLVTPCRPTVRYRLAGSDDDRRP